MRKNNIYLILLVIFANFNVFSQTGVDCQNAIPVATNNSCIYSNYTTSGTQFWLEFQATSPTVNISLITTKYGVDAPHIHELNLFEGACGSLNLVAEDELPFYNEAKELNIDLNASDLVIGQTYYIRADRQALLHECGRAQCTLNSSTNPTTFELCIKDITVVIPPDFSGEKPVSSLALETNRGQLVYIDGTPADEVIMFNDRTSPSLYICKDHVSYVHHGVYAGDTSIQRVDMSFEGANTNYDIFKTEPVAGITNYYLPHIPDGVTRNRSYSRVVSNNIYSKIDLQHYSNIAGMKNYYVIRPGGNYEEIVMKFDGATSIDNNNENLNVISELGTIHFEKPSVYYVNPGGQLVNMPFEAEYELIGFNKVKFNIPNYPSPPSMTLVIQMDQGHKSEAPKNIDNLLWSTYYGGAEDDRIEDVDHDEFGNVYFTGLTRGLMFPQASTTIYPTNNSTTSRMVVGSHEKLGRRRWSTIYGAQQDWGKGIATDKLGNVYVVGITGVFSEPNQFLDVIKPGAYNLAPANFTTSATYASIFKFNQGNGTVTWASLFGEHTATSFFDGNCIATDELGNVYIAGVGKRISNSPIVASGNQHLETTTNTKVGFVAGFNSSNALIWSTMFGNNDIVINEMNTTSNGDLYIVGSATGVNTSMFQAVVEQQNDYQFPYQGGSTDAFFAKFNNSNELKWASFFGGSGDDLGLGIDYIESAHSLFLTGQTNSTNSTFPILALSDPLVHNNDVVNGKDGFLSVLRDIPLVSDDPTTLGHVLKYSSYFGGSGEDLCKNIELTNAGNVYVIGMSKSSNFPLQQMINGFYQNTLENDPSGIHFDSFILGLNSDLQLSWSTLYGGEWYYQGTDNVNAQSDDIGSGITVYNDETIYIGGTTTADLYFPITVDLSASPNAFIQYENSGNASDTPNGRKDGFLAQFDLNNTPLLSLNEMKYIDGVEINIYPNPNNGVFTIIADKLHFDGLISIEVVNIIGQTVFVSSGIVSDGKILKTIEIPNSASGLYIVRLKSGNNSITKKITIK
jgi:hypothetical protein